MKNLAIVGTLLAAFLFSGCALQKRTMRNAQDIRQLDKNQKVMVKYLKKMADQQRRTEMLAKNNKMRAQKTWAGLNWVWRQVVGNKRVTFRVLTELLQRNYALGEGMFGDAYFLYLGEFFLMKKQYRKAYFYYTYGIRLLEAKMKKKAAKCRVMSCTMWLSYARYNRACVFALNNKKAAALKDLAWLDKTGNMKLFVDTKRPFWQDPDFKSLQGEKAYQQLVAKWKAWLAQQQKPKPQPKPQVQPGTQPPKAQPASQPKPQVQPGTQPPKAQPAPQPKPQVQPGTQQPKPKPQVQPAPQK